MNLDKILENVSSDLLTEETKKEIKTLIEAKINEKANEKIKELEKKFENYKEKELNTLEEKAVDYVDTFLIEKIDEYTDYVAEEYMKENSIALENGLKSEMYEKLVSDLKKVLSENQIKEEKVVESEELHTENAKLKEDLNTSIKNELELKKEIRGIKATMSFNEIASGLTESEKVKLQNLCEDFDIDNLDEFKNKVSTIKKSLKNLSDEEDTTTEENPINENYDAEISEGPKTISEEDEKLNLLLGSKYLN